MAWIELNWIVPRKEVDQHSAQLFELSALGVQEDFLPGEAPPPRQPWDTGPSAPLPEQVLLRAWWPNEQAETVRLQLAHLEQAEWHRVEPSDWGESWKENFTRHVISDRLAVSPPWLAQPSDVVIEPGIAFGSGEHPTTLSCLEGIDRWVGPGTSCLDVGCGSGILAIAAAHLGARASGVDIEEDAVVSARENAAKNKVTVEFSSTSISAIEGKYDVVVANLYAEVLVLLAADIIRVTGRHLALAGILADRADLVRDAFVTLECVRDQQEGDWVSLWYRKAIC